MNGNGLASTASSASSCAASASQASSSSDSFVPNYMTSCTARQETRLDKRLYAHRHHHHLLARLYCLAIYKTISNYSIMKSDSTTPQTSTETRSSGGLHRPAHEHRPLDLLHRHRRDRLHTTHYSPISNLISPHTRIYNTRKLHQ